MTDVLTWAIVALTIGAILIRPKHLPEAVWACLGAVLLILCGLLPIGQAAIAIGKGTDVYLFLAGMMLLSELARREGVFDWLASLAVSAAKGSCLRLFGLVYVVGVLVTVFLSNDATAVVLTPAVYAAIRKARAEPLPYLLICAFIANAASFVLPISNPANLVVYGRHIPPLVPWLRTFLLPSVCSIIVTYLLLQWFSRKDLKGRVEDGVDHPELSSAGCRAAVGIMGTGVVLISASAFGLDLGLPTCIAAVIAVLIAVRAKFSAVAEIARGVSWSVLPLVAGLFVLVEALSAADALRYVGTALKWCAAMPPLTGSLVASFGIAALSNVMNNLPSGLLAGGAFRTMQAPTHIRDAILIGVDLGPNLSVTGSLATLLWLIALRREGEQISAWRFLKIGVLIMPPALFAAVLASSL